MTKFEAWQIVNQSKGLYFSWKRKNSDDSHTFVFKSSDISYTLIVKSQWRILHYGEPYYDSVTFNTYSYSDLLLNHAGENLKVTEVSIADNFELHFMMKGKLELTIYTNKRSSGAYWITEHPKWVFMSGNKILVESPRIKNM